MNSLSHAYTNQEYKADIEQLPEENLKEMYQTIRKVFQDKNEESWRDIALYNIIRNKPVFCGVNKITQDKYFDFKYSYSNFKDRNLTYIRFNFGEVIYALMLNDSIPTEIVHLFIEELNKSFESAVTYN